MFVILLWVCIHTGQAETLPDHSGNRTRDLDLDSHIGILVHFGIFNIDIEGTRLNSEISPLEPTWPRSSVGRALD